MKKLYPFYPVYRWLAIFTLLTASGCRLKDATQTVVEVKPDPTMRQLVASMEIEAFALHPGLDDVSLGKEPRTAVVWPLRRTFTTDSKSSSHSFRMVGTAFDAADMEVANFTLETDVVEGATRYVVVRLDEACRPSNCEGGKCPSVLDVEEPGSSRQEAFCRGRGTNPSMAADGGDMTVTGVGRSDGTSAQSGGTGPGSSAAPDGGTAANGSTGMQTSGQLAQDAGLQAPPPPPSNVAECQNHPCGTHGVCGLKPDAPNGYVCTCETGYELDDATSATCVVRDDCNKKNGGCEGTCETVIGTGEAKCSCSGDTWLGGDGKQCAEVQPEEALSISIGSTQRTRPQVAFDTEGNGVVAWTETGDDGVHTMWSARYAADTKVWEKPTRPFLTSTTNAADLHLALDATGSGLLVWTATVDSHRQLWATRYRNHGFSAAAQRIDRDVDGEAKHEVLMPAFALDSAGDGLVAWTHAVYPTSSLRVARYSASTNAFTAMDSGFPSIGDSLVFNTSVALHSSESGLIAWTNVPVAMPDGGLDVQFRNSSAFNVKVGSDLAQGAGFGDEKSNSTSPDVAMDATGRGVAVWLRKSDVDDSFAVLSGVYVSGAGWNTKRPETLTADASELSAPHIAVGADGTAFAVWRKLTGTGTGSDTKSLTRAALRVGIAFDSSNDLGLESDAAAWNDVDPNNWTVESTVTAIDQLQPHWDLAVGPYQTGFVVGAAFNTSTAPTQRELWLQRVVSESQGQAPGPAGPIRFSVSDAVPARPSAPRIGMNARGDGALVWDRQRDGHYFVYASLLQ